MDCIAAMVALVEVIISFNSFTFVEGEDESVFSRPGIRSRGIAVVVLAAVLLLLSLRWSKPDILN